MPQLDRQLDSPNAGEGDHVDCLPAERLPVWPARGERGGDGAPRRRPGGLRPAPAADAPDGAAASRQAATVAGLAVAIGRTATGDPIAQALAESATEAQAIRALRDEAERAVRARLAASLHDGVGQTLQSLNLGLKQARALAGSQESVPAELLDRLIGEAAEALAELRALSCELRPLFLERLALPEALRFHCREIAERSGLAIRVRAPDTPLALAARTKEQCFLAFREALNNAVRHARASVIEVALKVSPEKRLTLTVADNGVGFDIRRARSRPTGLGLCMIRERAEGVMGRACIRSTPGRGTLVRICIPIERGPLLCPLGSVLRPGAYD